MLQIPETKGWERGTFTVTEDDGVVRLFLQTTALPRHQNREKVSQGAGSITAQLVRLLQKAMSYWARWHRPVVPACERLKQEAVKFEDSLAVM